MLSRGNLARGKKWPQNVGHRSRGIHVEGGEGCHVSMGEIILQQKHARDGSSSKTFAAHYIQGGYVSVIVSD